MTNHGKQGNTVNSR